MTLVTHLTFGMLLYYLEKLKSNFSRYSANMDKNTNKLHLKFTAFNSSMRVTVYVECIYVLTEYLKYSKACLFSLVKCGWL